MLFSEKTLTIDVKQNAKNVLHSGAYEGFCLGGGQKKNFGPPPLATLVP